MENETQNEILGVFALLPTHPLCTFTFELFLLVLQPVSSWNSR